MISLSSAAARCRQRKPVAAMASMRCANSKPGSMALQRSHRALNEPRASIEQGGLASLLRDNAFPRQACIQADQTRVWPLRVSVKASAGPVPGLHSDVHEVNCLDAQAAALRCSVGRTFESAAAGCLSPTKPISAHDQLRSCPRSRRNLDLECDEPNSPPGSGRFPDALRSRACWWMKGSHPIGFRLSNTSLGTGRRRTFGLSPVCLRTRCCWWTTLRNTYIRDRKRNGCRSSTSTIPTVRQIAGLPRCFKSWRRVLDLWPCESSEALNASALFGKSRLKLYVRFSPFLMLA